jgi:hypothetical protein
MAIAELGALHNERYAHIHTMHVNESFFDAAIISVMLHYLKLCI